MHIATQTLLLRQLYLPLRVTVEGGQRQGDTATRLEERRQAWRRWEAGHDASLTPRQQPPDPQERAPAGARLAEAQRLVVLGDPGGGKTTLLRWMATAYLLKRTQDDEARQLPDVETLPDMPWIPVLIRCRDLSEAALGRCFSDLLGQHLKRTDMLPEDAQLMQAVILDRIAKGQVLLLVDGLDEVTHPQVRVLLCQELEHTAARYPAAPIVVTSRVVGYRDMPYRMGRDFEHCLITPLSAEDKDDFAQRWVRATYQNFPSAEQASRIEELRQALHSSDRIERLASNPMMLTTLALVKRKVGKLPSRRTKLYHEAVSVLLNWNPRFYEVIEDDEAIPQLEFVAFEMCRRGVQRLHENELLDLLEQLRQDYRRLRAVRRRSAEEFLHLLKARSSLLIKAGGAWDRELVRANPVWEFRHLTFQEYLAARALIDGRYPGRERGPSLAEQVGPLAGVVEEADSSPGFEKVVHESWRETLRLMVSDCPDDDVDDVLLAILRPAAGEDAAVMARPRAIQAALCLADEPNVSDEVAEEVLRRFASQVGENDGLGSLPTPVDSAAREVGRSVWTSLTKRVLIEEFRDRNSITRENPGGLYAIVAFTRTKLERETALAERLVSEDPLEKCAAALVAMVAAFEGRLAASPELIEGLMSSLHDAGPLGHAAAWALGWLGSFHGPGKAIRPIWNPKDEQVAALVAFFPNIPNSAVRTRYWIEKVLGDSANPQGLAVLFAGAQDRDEDNRRISLEGIARQQNQAAVAPLLAGLEGAEPELQEAVFAALGAIGDTRAVPHLSQLLVSRDEKMSLRAALALHRLHDPRGTEVMRRSLRSTERKVRTETFSTLARSLDAVPKRLLSRDLDGLGPWLDPQDPIPTVHLTNAAVRLSLPEAEIREYYEMLAPIFDLSLEWKP